MAGSLPGMSEDVPQMARCRCSLRHRAGCLAGGRVRWKPVGLPVRVIGATSVVRRAGACTTGTGEWLRGLLERKPARLVTVAMANKTARIAWAVMALGEEYRAA